MDVAIIPAYNPDEKMIALVRELKENNLNVLIVDDGSSIACTSLFKEAEKYAVVIHSPCNEGKGSALKRGFACVRNFYPECENVVTADADGQHRVNDILRVAKELHNGSSFVLSVRNFEGDIPFRSKIGNNLSRWVYAVITGHYFVDNQSGLRGFSVRHIEWLLKVEGEKYDYEMNMLCYADKQAIPITTITIETVYIDDNKSSHFNPVADTLRIYKRLFLSVWPTLVSVANLESNIMYISIIFGYDHLLTTVPAACMSSAVVGLILNKFLRFRRVRYADGTRTLVHTAFRTIIYTMVCLNVGIYTTKIPLFVTFNLIAFTLIPLEYLLHKIMHKNKYRDINKER